MSVTYFQANERDEGFTLFEMLVALAILALALAFAVPAFQRSNGRASIRPLAAELTGTLRTARSLAITGNRPVTILLDPETRSYGIEGYGKPQSLPSSIALAFNTTNELGRPEADSRITFFPDGSSTGGNVTLFDKKQVISLNVAWLTGAIVAQRTSR